MRSMASPGGAHHQWPPEKMPKCGFGGCHTPIYIFILSYSSGSSGGDLPGQRRARPAGPGRRRPGWSGRRCCYGCCCRCMLLDDYMYMNIYYITDKKLAYFLRKYNCPRKLIICFENMIFSFENMSASKKNYYLLRKYDLISKRCPIQTKNI